MERFVKGDIVVIPFPFSNLTGKKRRPALVITDMEGDDLILCQITSQYSKDQYAIELMGEDLASGFLTKSVSAIRPNRIFTADKSIIDRKVASVKNRLMRKVTDAIIHLIS